MFPFVSSLLLAVAVAAPLQAQSSNTGVIPTGLADGPYVHVMARHHEEGVRMASLASTKASHAGVKALAGRVLARQQTELGQLKQFMTTVAEDMAPAGKSTLKTMPVEKLEQATGAAFDRMFLDMMIEHHQDALSMTQGAKLIMPGVKDFALRMTLQHTADLKEMQDLRKQIGGGDRIC
jgi:uncharacterized protein (DUF305 family)